MAGTETQVLVVGAGAAGTMLALSLARHGIDARVVDRLPAPSPYSRAVTVHARMLEIFEQIDSRLVETYLDAGNRSPGYVMHYVTPDGKRHEARPGLDFRSLASRYPFLLVNSQRETERILRDYLLEQFGRAPEWGTTCTAVEDLGNHALATLRHADGREELVRCRYLVACDGVNSRIRAQLGLTQEGSDYAGTVLQNLDVELLGFPDDPAWMHYCMGPGHFVMAAKLPGKFTRLLMSQPADKADAAATPHHVFGGILAQHFDGIRFGETDWHSRWGSVVRLAHSYRRGAVFLAGDAAHTHSTAGGQGMNCCMQDAWNLGWKLGYVLRGAAPESVLESYERERKPIGSQVIGAASAIHELFMAGRNSGPEGLRALRDSGFLDELLGKVSGLSYHYRAEGAAAGALPAAGDRMPNVALPAGAGGQWVLDLLRHTKFTLLAVAPDSIDAAAEKWLADSAQKRRGCVEGRVLPHAPRVLAAADGGTYCYLVRPDGYVAASAPAHETGALERALGEWLS